MPVRVLVSFLSLTVNTENDQHILSAFIHLRYIHIYYSLGHVSQSWRSIRYTEVIDMIRDFQDLNMQPVHNAC
jgi:hypothetical protein